MLLHIRFSSETSSAELAREGLFRLFPCFLWVKMYRRSMHLQVEFPSELCSTDLAREGLFTCVNNFVTLKLTEERKCSSAVITFMSMICIESDIGIFVIFVKLQCMPLQVAFLSKLYATYLTGEGLLPCVNNFMSLEVGIRIKILSAVLTLKTLNVFCIFNHQL